MARPRHRSDANAGEITVALRRAGAHVIPLESPREGQPDLIVGFLGRLSLLEIKSAEGRLSADQKEARKGWARVGVRVHVVRTERQAFDAVGITGPLSEQNRAAMRQMQVELEASRPPRRPRGFEGARLRPAVRRYGGPTSAWEEAWEPPPPLPAGCDPNS